MACRVLAAGALSLLLGASVPAAADDYQIDPRHTFPSFEVSHLGISLQRGRFNKVSGSITLDAAGGKGSLVLIVDAASIAMGFEDWNR